MIGKDRSLFSSLSILLTPSNQEMQSIEPLYRQKQLIEWVVKPNVVSINQFSNYPVALRNELKHKYQFNAFELNDKKVSEDGTRRYVFSCRSDQSLIETVYIPTSKRGTVCLSTQIGCALGCRFCASGSKGLKRHLKASEIIDQVRYLIQDESLNITHLVFMGIGEPLHNYEAVSESIWVFNEYFKIGMRRITVSTSGLIPQIMKLAEQFPQVGLAISLHSVLNNKRTEIMPINKKYNVNQLLKAVSKYIEKTNKKVTFEYTLMQGVNDGDEDMRAIVRLLKKFLCRINIIPMNSHEMSQYQAPDKDRIYYFVQYLKERGLQVVVRRTRGRDINASCGQLRLRK